MTVTEATTRTLDAPGATITYDVRPGGDGSQPPLMLIGSPMGAAGFATLASHFPDRTVVTYDPRGAERSTKDDPSSESNPGQHADDLHRIIQEVGGPVDLFASSGGAVNALALVAAHPDDVRTLVAHEPPLAALLPDADNAKAAVRAISDSYEQRRLRRRAWRTSWRSPAIAASSRTTSLSSRRRIRPSSACRPRTTATGPTCCSTRTSSAARITSRTSMPCARRVDADHPGRRRGVAGRDGEPRRLRGREGAGHGAGRLPEPPRWLPGRRVRLARRARCVRREAPGGPRLAPR